MLQTHEKYWSHNISTQSKHFKLIFYIQTFHCTDAFEGWKVVVRLMLNVLLQNLQGGYF